MPESRKKNDLDLLQCGSLGLELAVALGVGALLGHYADTWLSTPPLLLVIGCMLGLLAGMYRVVRTVQGLQARGPRHERPARPPGEPPDEHTGQP